MARDDERDPWARSTLAEVEAYWRSLGSPGRPPARAAVDPGRIDAALPHAFVLERVAPGVGRMRVAGQEVTRLLGVEARGMPVSALFAAPSRDRLGHWVERAFADPALVDLPLTAARGPLRAPARGRLLLLPLLDSEGEPTRALGALLLDSAPARGPAPLDIPEGEVIRHEPVAAPATLRYAMAGAAARLGLREAERPYLRLVVSNG